MHTADSADRMKIADLTIMVLDMKFDSFCGMDYGEYKGMYFVPVIKIFVTQNDFPFWNRLDQIW